MLPRIPFGLILVEAKVSWLVALNLLSASVMMTIGWYVQLVHYPSFRFISSETFKEFHSMHTKWTGAIVLPAMLAEGIAGALIFVGKRSVLSGANFGFALLAIANTFIVFTSIHAQLAVGKDDDVINALVRKNWFRTICWTGHAVSAWLLVDTLQ